MAVQPGQLLVYAGGEALSRFGTFLKRTSRRDEVIETHSRSSVGWARTRSGILVPWEANVPRVTWVDTDGDGVPDKAAYLLEGARENLIDDQDLTTFSTTGTPTVTGGQSDPAGGTDAFLVEDDDGGSVESIREVVSFTGDALKAVAVHLKEGTSPPASGTMVLLRDTTAGANRLDATVTWANGGPAVSMTDGVHLATLEYTDGWYRLLFQTESVTAANGNQFQLHPAGTTAETGTVFAFQPQVEDARFPSSDTPTSGSTVTQATDALFFDYTADPQAMSVYTKHVEMGTALTNFARLWSIGGTNNDPSLQVFADSSVAQYRFRIDDGSNNGAQTAANTVAIGDVVETLVTVTSSGTATLSVAVNGGSTVSSSSDSIPALPQQWAAARLYLNNNGSSNEGHNAFIGLKVALGVHSLADMREAP